MNIPDTLRALAVAVEKGNFRGAEYLVVGLILDGNGPGAADFAAFEAGALADDRTIVNALASEGFRRHLASMGLERL
jgi:hypothetical protein